MPRQLVLDLHHAVDRRRRVLVSAPFVTAASRWWRLSNSQLSRDAFIALRCCTLRALSPVDLPHSQTRLAAEDEWLEIMGEEPHMTREAFFASLLEIVDACLPPLSDEDACAAALDALFAAVTTPTPRRWRSAANVSFVETAPEPPASAPAASRPLPPRQAIVEPSPLAPEAAAPEAAPEAAAPAPEASEATAIDADPQADVASSAALPPPTGRRSGWRTGKLRSSLSEGVTRPAGRAQPVPLPSVTGAVGAARGGALRSPPRRCDTSASLAASLRRDATAPAAADGGAACYVRSLGPSSSAPMLRKAATGAAAGAAEGALRTAVANDTGPPVDARRPSLSEMKIEMRAPPLPPPADAPTASSRLSWAPTEHARALEERRQRSYKSAHRPVYKDIWAPSTAKPKGGGGGGEGIVWSAGPGDRPTHTPVDLGRRPKPVPDAHGSQQHPRIAVDAKLSRKPSAAEPAPEPWATVE